MDPLDAGEVDALREGYDKLKDQLAKLEKEYDKLRVENAVLRSKLDGLRDESAIAIEFMGRYKDALRILGS